MEDLGGFVHACYIPRMSDQESEHDQRRDALLLRLLKTPPQTREELAEQVRRAKGLKPTRQKGKSQARTSPL